MHLLMPIFVVPSVRIVRRASRRVFILYRFISAIGCCAVAYQEFERSNNEKCNKGADWCMIGV